jgi:hypothetical protein
MLQSTGTTGLLSGAPKKALTSLRSSNGALKTVDGLFVPTDGEITLPLILANSTGNPTVKIAAGLNADFQSDLSDSTESGVMLPVFSSVHSLDQFASNSGTPMLYQAFDCGYPYKLGSSCNLKLRVSNGSRQGKSTGKLYVYDQTSDALPIPVYVGYNLALDQHAVSVPENTSGVDVSLGVASAEGYDSIKVEGFPGTVDTSDCSDMKTADQCSITFITKNMKEASYHIKVSGVRNGKVLANDADTEALTLNITPKN